ncbi:transcription initiation protein [Rhizobium sp. Root1220]|nr:transcription initiation protein [Rhizobium sp. Root1220]
MPRFVAIGYGDEAGYERTDKLIRADAHAHDAKLQQAGVEMGMAGRAVQVRNHETKEVTVSEGPFMRSELPVAGFALIEAADLAEAIEIVSKTPCAVAYGVVEVWPLEQRLGS